MRKPVPIDSPIRDKKKTRSKAPEKASHCPELSIVLGGPVYDFYLRFGLAAPPLQLVRRRIIAVSLLCWLPLLSLSAASGTAIAGVPVPFLKDAEAQIRFLITIPLLLVGELFVHQRLIPIVQQFLDRKIVWDEDRQRFEEIISSTIRLRNSAVLEVLLLVLTFASSHWFWKERFALATSSWYAIGSGGETHLTPAGVVYGYLSLPIFRFILFRWYLRILLWYQFLWRVSRLPLHLNLFHPDRAGGLGFLQGSGTAFLPFLLAHSTLLAGFVADRIWHSGASLPEFKMQIAGSLFVLLILVLAPLTFFAWHLEEGRRTALREYGILASRYVNKFHSRWIQHAPEEPLLLLGTPDIQSLADLGNAYGVVSTIRIAPLNKEMILRLVLWLVVPILPLTLTMVPLSRIIDWFLKLVL
ncbi:MAG TPA: hypothetical protein VN708_00250 [Terriglobales bacterium]|nr:hypothetical protein [Terriglobales bacterium]